MRWLLSSSITLSLATGTAVAVTDTETSIVANDTTISSTSNMIGATEPSPLFMSEEYIAQMIAEEEAEKQRIIAEVALKLHRENAYKNKIAMEERISLLEAQVGKTWYVFGGSTPRGWDCSGLVKWFYGGLGVELHHGASAQKNSGVKVDSPLRGDLVSFGHNADSAGHIGIYISPDVMIHVGRPGQTTSYRSISEFGKVYGEVIYTRILDTE
jgi:hypothetical protein